MNSRQIWSERLRLIPALTAAPSDRDIKRNASRTFGTKQNFGRRAPSPDFSAADSAVRLCPESYDGDVSSQTTGSISDNIT